MHCKTFVPRTILLRFLALSLALCCSFVAAKVHAQGLSQGMIIPINVTKRIAMPPGAKVQKVNVAKPGIVRIEVSLDATTVLITGEAPGATQLAIINDKGGVQEINVVVQTDVEFLRYLIKRTVPTANVEPIPVGNNVIILSGTVAKSEDVPIILATAQSVAGQGVVNGMRVGGVMQVQLDVVIAQVSRNEIRRMSFTFFKTGQRRFLASLFPGGTGNASLNITPGTITSTVAGTSNLLYGFVDDQGGFFTFLQALRDENLAKFLAEPRLVTMSGRPAHFLSGGRLAIPEPSGLGTTAVRYEDFGTELSFLPIVLGNGKIHLEVEPVVNNVNQSLGTSIQGTIVPGFDTQRLHTSVELEDGQTYVLGGLIQTQINATSSKVPVLGDIPFLSPFFSSKSYDQREVELLIIITPHLVDAVTCNQLPKYLPGQETRIPDDFELFLEGILEAPRGQRAICQGGRYQAAYRSGPTAGVYPCGGYGCGYGCAGSCYSGLGVTPNRGAQTNANAPANHAVAQPLPPAPVHGAFQPPHILPAGALEPGTTQSGKNGAAPGEVDFTQPISNGGLNPNLPVILGPASNGKR